MTLAELIATARSRSGDTPTPPLWTDAEWTGYANEAEREACRRARLIVDSTTTAIARITLVAATPTYALSPKVLFIRRAKLDGVSPSLRRISYLDLDQQAPDWETETGEPRGYIPDFDTNLFRPYPIPNASGTVRLTVVRLPLADMTLTPTVTSPEIGAHLHESLIDWMLYRAYSKADADTQDDAKAAKHLELFEREFGKKSTAIDEAWIQREHGYTEDEGVF